MPDPSTANVLLHIGAPKTGTTSLQAALDDAQDRLYEHGVVLPAGESNPKFAAVGGAGTRAGALYERAWTRLVDAVAGQEARLSVISSEHFAYARQEDAKRVVAALGGARVRVVITLRPLVELLPSRWQQFVQTGETDAYHVWLEKVLSGPPSGEYQDRYWIQLWHRRLIERWAAAAGPENLIVIPVDKRSPDLLFRNFASLLEVPEGLLSLSEHTKNDSFGAAETELLRNCHEQLRGLESGKKLAGRLLAGGVGRMYERPVGRSASRDIITPRWARERAVAMGEELAEWLPATGITILGDAAWLKGESVADGREPAPLDPASAARAVTGVIQTAIEQADQVRGDAEKSLAEQRRRAEHAERLLRVQQRRTELAQRQRDKLAATPSAERARTAVLLRILWRRFVSRLRFGRGLVERGGPPAQEAGRR